MSNLIVEITENDVLSGRGGKINAHPGNVQFRNIIVQFKHAYKQANRFEKMMISDTVVKNIRSLNPPGRFLAEVKGSWVDIGEDKARSKVSQALREKKNYKQDHHQHSQQEQDKETMQLLEIPPVHSEMASPRKQQHTFSFSSPVAERKQASQLNPRHGSPLSVILPTGALQKERTSSMVTTVLDRRNSNVRLSSADIKEKNPHQMRSSLDLCDEDTAVLLDDTVQEVVPHINSTRGPLEEKTTKSLNTSSHSKRTLFHQLSQEATCLPTLSSKPITCSSTLQEDDNDDLLRESFKSIGSTVETKSQIELSCLSKHQAAGEHLAAVERGGGLTKSPTDEEMEDFSYAFSNSLRLSIDITMMDSTDMLIQDTFMSSINSFDVYDDENRLLDL